ncbi:hypothetical protein GA0070606_5119 [Micromonospora citrea]|uniref:BNR repeat-like domain-containing protein n=1 Tax=Micromonospora citrea TaxID=47855 RepID=A0A1C6VTB3_9ACTN|nr:hypothetical protein [Micromonospora citrea]SCL69561.1 hypothetical protein GA0070606_5119 [Micromonospora citrea]
MRIRRLVAVLGVLAVLSVGCDRAPVEPADEPLRPRWQALTLPAPPGAAGRPLLRDAVACAGRWYVVGGLADATGETRPAAWGSADGVSWSALPVAASSFYGRQHVLYAVACREGRLAALGAKNGGVHGNPRTGTWALAPGGALREVPAPFELYAGPRAVSVARLAAGPAGWLIAGARVDGAAVWTSADGERFAVREGVPELAGDGRGRTVAYDAVAVPSGWWVVGAVLPPGATALAPLAWSSADGRAWRRVALPVPDGRGQAQRVAAVDGGLVAVGPVRDGFGAWRLVGDEWRRVGGFRAAGSGVSSVDGLVSAGRALVAVSGDGDGHRLWSSVDAGDSWRAMAMPDVVPDGGNSAVGVALQGDRLLLVADDGQASRAWWLGLSTIGR